MPSTSTSGPHQRIRTSWASSSSGVERLVGQPQHLEDLRLRQPFTPLEHLVAGDVEDRRSSVVVTARESATCHRAEGASP